MGEKVLVLRNCKPDYTSPDGFRWPKSGPVECQDWDPRVTYGHGFHGLRWGLGDWTLLEYNPDSPDAVWQVVEVDASEIVDVGLFVKFPRGNVLYSGSMAEAVSMVARDDGFLAASSGKFSAAVSKGSGSRAITSGAYSTAVSGGNYSSATTSGEGSSAIAGGGYGAIAESSGFASRSLSTSAATSRGEYSIAVSAGEYAVSRSHGEHSFAAAAGNHSIADSHGDYSRAISVGESSTVSSAGRDTLTMAAGVDSVVSAGEKGCLVALWYDIHSGRHRVKVGYIGEEGLKPNTPYTLTRDGQWKEVESVCVHTAK